LKDIKKLNGILIDKDIGKDKEAIIRKSKWDWVAQILLNHEDKKYYIEKIRFDYFDDLDELIKFIEIVRRNKYE
jgi:hypothetical protein